MFICLERVLLVIGCEFYDQCSNSEAGKNDIRLGKGCVGLEGGNFGRVAQQEKQNVLRCSYECQVDNLE